MKKLSSPKKVKTKRYRILVIILILALMLPAFGIIQGVVMAKKHDASLQLSDQDKDIINDISNMTGIKSEEIINLKTKDNTWNDVLNEIKNNADKNINRVQDGSALLAESGLDQDYLKKLRNEGFEYSKINETKSLVERINSLLEQIMDFKNEKLIINSKVNQSVGNDVEIEAYRELMESIDLKTAIYLLLKLEKDFGSIMKVLDEYLLSIQVDIDLNKYLIDRKAYEKDKNEQTAKFDMDKIITVQKIEDKVLELLQNDNEINKTPPDNLEGNQTEINSMVSNEIDSDDIKMPIPDIQNPKPRNPQYDVLEELNNLINKSLN